jgi:tetratricopeptide (TPR) repeat protein
MTQNNLGNAYSNGIWEERAEKLEAAICSYSAALQVYTCEAFPQNWAIIQNNLGTAYCKRIWGERSENLEVAIRCYSAALEVHTPEASSEKWAMTLNNLGVAYCKRICGERAKNLGAAIRCYLAALKVYNREAYPQNYAATQLNLGTAYQDARQFPNAYAAFASAIDSVEALRSQIIFGDEIKEKLAQKWNNLYQRMVEVCLELGNYDQAIEYVERSKARNLVELLATRDLYPKGDIPETVLDEFKRLRREIAAQQRRIEIGRRDDMDEGMMSDGRSQAITNSPAANGSTDSTALNALWQQLDNLITQEIKPIDPTFSLTQRVEPVSFQQIQIATDDKTALIEWYITDNTFSALSSLTKALASPSGNLLQKRTNLE